MGLLDGLADGSFDERSPGSRAAILLVLSEIAKFQLALGGKLFSNFSYAELVEHLRSNKSIEKVLGNVAKLDVELAPWNTEDHFDGLIRSLLEQQPTEGISPSRMRKARVRYLRGVAYWVAYLGSDVFDDYLSVKLVAIVSVELGTALGLVGNIGFDESLKKVARMGAEARYATHRDARDFVCSKWIEEKGEYKGNKSDFARTYQRIVHQKFVTPRGEPLQVTTETIRNSWLKGL